MSHWGIPTPQACPGEHALRSGGLGPREALSPAGTATRPAGGGPTGGTAFCKHTGEQQGRGTGPHPAPPPTPTEGLELPPGPLPWEPPPDMKP